MKRLAHFATTRGHEWTRRAAAARLAPSASARTIVARTTVRYGITSDRVSASSSVRSSGVRTTFSCERRGMSPVDHKQARSSIPPLRLGCTTNCSHEE
jgi:hypothetical protein